MSKVLSFKSGVKTHNRFDISRDMLTTLNFGQVVPLFFEECVPGDYLNVKLNGFVRTEPLVFPSFARVNLRTMGVYVDYHTLSRQWSPFVTNMASFRAMNVQIPAYIYVSDFMNMLIKYYSTNASAEDFDIMYTYINSSSEEVNAYIKLTSKGRNCLKIFNALGYSLPSPMKFNYDSSKGILADKYQLNPMNLLAFTKAYYDFLHKNSTRNTSELAFILEKVYSNVGSTRIISYVELKSIFDAFCVVFSGDYFICAENNTNGVEGNNSIKSNEYVNRTSGVVETTQTLTDSYPQLNSLRSYQDLRFIKSISQFVQRNKMYGNDVSKILEARFGIKGELQNSMYSHLIGVNSSPVQIGDVTSLANTGADGSFLGDYAGKAIVSIDNSFKYKCDSHGAFIVLGWLEVKPIYGGSLRSALRVRPMDFFNPEFDGVGVDAISYQELNEYNKTANGRLDTETYQNVFGFVPRYLDYKDGSSKSRVCGDYNHRVGYDAWHLQRNMYPITKNHSDILAQSDLIMKYDNTLIDSQGDTISQFDRIFQNNSSYDKFYLSLNFKVDAFRPMKNISGGFDLEEGEITTEILHQEV
ncbi:major capsid protein [Capybara microvirus Cap1_SP_119]|nr:major capsid protein [Capybara microvirus Cap1_SP_119]